MLTYLAPGILPDADALARGAEINDQGHGFAIVVGDRILVRKDHDPARLIATFATARARHPEGPALFHSRLATHGSLSKANMHPFRVGNDSRTVVAHNGILPHSVHPGPGDRRSDTRVFADERLGNKPFANYDDPTSRARLEAWLGPFNKVAVLTVNRRYAEQAYVFNENRGFYDNGVWYSNTDFTSREENLLELWADWRACPTCNASEADVETGLCEVCGSCVECGESEKDCSRWCARRYLVEVCPGCREVDRYCVCVEAMSPTG
ncbi:hypothetical protein AB0878_44890 [Amycolatopsis sp. NPDC047767]|uniref:hypothetical protein n=1 Tax=Amycolatopsis sp. NPDC047767 TaxID=3156765 RepID=UPI003452964C